MAISRSAGSPVHSAARASNSTAPGSPSAQAPGLGHWYKVASSSPGERTPAAGTKVSLSDRAAATAVSAAPLLARPSLTPSAAPYQNRNPRRTVGVSMRARSGPRHSSAAFAYRSSLVAAADSHSMPGQKPLFHSGSSA